MLELFGLCIVLLGVALFLFWKRCDGDIQLLYLRTDKRYADIQKERQLRVQLQKRVTKLEDQNRRLTRKLTSLHENFYNFQQVFLNEQRNPQG